MLDKETVILSAGVEVIHHVDESEKRMQFLESLTKLHSICENEELKQCIERLFGIL